MDNWIRSIYSDGTGAFVSNPQPVLGEEITIRVRCLADAPVKGVYLRQMVNGAEVWLPMEKEGTFGGLQYYAVKITVNEPRCCYHFAFTLEDEIIFYNQQGTFTTLTDDSHDFVLLTDYRKPSWTDGSVIYQIFPERFANGKDELTPKDGQYTYMGHKTIVREHWDDVPLSVEEAAGMEFFGGDLYGVIDKIPYLKELGVTAVYLNPIFTSYSMHKYDCNDYSHVDEHFGGDEALAALSDALHAEGMKLILDISINHTGIENKWVKEGKPFYFKREDGSLEGWWNVPTLPILDFRSEELRDLVYRGKDAALRKWLRPPYNIDGWRFDVADVFARHNDVQLADELWPEICAAIREENPDAIIIGEHWADCAHYLQGDQWNTPMNYYGFGRIIRQFAGLNDLFLERNPGFKDVKSVMRAGDVVRRTKDHYDNLPQAVADCQMNLFDSHDIPRLHNCPGIDPAKWKSAVIAQFFWTGIPCIYYGDEVGIDGHDISDAGCRYPMPWGRVTPEGEEHLKIIKTMTALRHHSPAFAKGGRMVLYSEGQVLAVARFYEEEVYVGVISMEDKEKTVSLPLSLVGVASPAENEDVFGTPLKGRINGNDYELTIPAFGSVVFACR